jgi:DnaJ domain
MAITTDFLLLYEELRVTPECSIEHFKRAYRRRVAELHPDRAPGQPNAAAMGRLQNLMRLHDEAMRFHARHRRLPGANQAAQIAPGGDAPARSNARADESMSPFSAARGILIGALVLGAVAILWLLLPSEEPVSDPAAQDRTSMTQIAPPRDAQHFLAIGMDENGVRRIQGEPAMLTTDRWEYGPSYVRFEKHKVVGWYSSPVYPLKIGASGRNAPKSTE